ncbi:WD domain, G-beta repeat [Carpediemonas membranifera]|uniref:WD domain, G-beta repeat n=1 Tax=Carpediemonas membranifera TaxID=201153 RepID=A0A8J6BB73_9EUKA|nr:WD domain, G-beta repeat [Carpediemonas membranifera]|eukprot:KAG9393717.1 WD domain, G-beta repeat [Carpediemonas membranifera]
MVRIEAAFSRSDNCRAVDTHIHTASSKHPGPEGIQILKRGETPITVQDIEQVIQYLLSESIEPETLTMELTEPAVTVMMVRGRLEADHDDVWVEFALEAWNTRSMKPMEAGECVRTLTGHESVVHGAAATPDGSIATTSYDGTVKLWDSATGQCISRESCVKLFIPPRPDRTSAQPRPAGRFERQGNGVHRIVIEGIDWLSEPRQVTELKRMRRCGELCKYLWLSMVI